MMNVDDKLVIDVDIDDDDDDFVNLMTYDDVNVDIPNSTSCNPSRGSDGATSLGGKIFNLLLHLSIFLCCLPSRQNMSKLRISSVHALFITSVAGVNVATNLSR